MAKEIRKNRNLIQILADLFSFLEVRSMERQLMNVEVSFLWEIALELARYVFQAKFKVRCLYHNDLFKNF